MNKFFLFLIVVTGILVAPELSKAQLTFTVYDTANSGLPNNWTTFIKEDTLNNIWIGSPYGGLTKFDGTNWTVYDTSNSDIPDNSISCIFIGEDGKKYIGTHNGFSIFNDTTWINYDMSNSTITSNWVGSIFLDSVNNLWVGSHELTKYDGTNWINYNSSNSNLSTPTSVGEITVDSLGNMLISCASNYQVGLYQFDGTNFTANPNLNNCPSATKIDKQGFLWQSYFNCSYGQGGIGKYSNSVWTNYTMQNSAIPDNYINDIAFDSANNVWITCYSRGIARFDGTNWIDYYPSNSNFPAFTASKILFDHLNRIWITTKTNGVILLQNPFTNIQEQVKRSKISLYPNPFSTQTTVETEIPLINATLKMENCLGQTVKQIKNISGKQIILQRDNLPSGVYVLRLSEGSKILATDKIIIMN